MYTIVANMHHRAKRAAYQAGVFWGPGYLCRSRCKQTEGDVEDVLDQSTAHRVKLPVTDQMFVQQRLHQKVQMPSF